MNEASATGCEPSIATITQHQVYSQHHNLSIASQPIATIDMPENTKIDKLSLVPAILVLQPSISVVRD